MHISSPDQQKAAIFVGQELENYDGTGGRDRLMHDEIPLASVIFRAINLIETISLQPLNPRETIIEGIRKAHRTILASLGSLPSISPWSRIMSGENQNTKFSSAGSRQE